MLNSKKIKVLGLCFILISSILFSQTQAFASSLPGSMTLSVKSTYSVGEDIVVNWSASANATKYGLTVWKAPYTTDQYAVWDNYVTGTSKDIGTLPAGSYLVQMKPYNAAGGGPNTNIASFSVTAPAPVQPVATPSPTALPGDMTLSVNSTYNTGENIVVNWTASANATKYGLTVWKAPYTTDQYAVWDNYVTGTSKDIGTLPAGSYLVQMKPYNAAGGGPNTNIASFTVTAPAPVQPVATPSPTALPGAMTLSVNSTYSVGEDIVINWTASANATKYGLTVWKAPYTTDQYAVWDNYVTGTSKDIGTLPAGSYLVQMKPYNAAGGGPNTNIASFSVTAPAPVQPVATPSPTVLPGAMTLSVNSTYNTGENIVINWTASANATKYGLTVWKAPYTTDQYAVWDNYVTGTSKDIGTLPAGSYLVQMKPYNSAGGGPNTNIASFSVTAPAATVQPVVTVSPTALPGAMTLSVNATYKTGEDIVINWAASTNATKYGLTVWKAPYTTDQYAVWDHYVTGISKDVGALPAGNYCVAMKPYNSAGGGPGSNVAYFSVTTATQSVPKSSGGDYYVLFMNDMDLNVAGTKLGEAVGHVGLFFYTTDRTNSGLNYYFSYGSYQPNGILEGLITKTILADTKIFRGNSSTDYASYLKNKGYDRFIAFKISSRDLYMKMMGKAIDLAGIANVYDLATNNCFQNACKVMSVDSQYFNMWTSGNAVLDIGLEPDNAFDTIANYYKTSPIYIDKINSNNFTSTIVSDSIRDN